MMTIEEAKKMVGTEFTYIYSDGDSVRAYVKAFDPEIGLTCVTLDTVTARGSAPASADDPNNDGWAAHLEKDGTWCGLAADFKKAKNIKKLQGIVLKILEGIARHGHHRVVENNFSISAPHCAF